MADPMPRSVRIEDAVGGAAAAWARGELEQALRGRGVPVAADAGFIVSTAIGRNGPERADLPQSAEAMALLPTPDGVLAWGADERGLVYALTELADRVRYGEGELFGALPLVERAAVPIRSIARLFCSEAEDQSWFHDRQHWQAYLSMLATQRFNRFALTLGMGYNYPYHNNYITDVYFYFPYPFLLDVPGYGIHVAELDPEERDANLAMLKYIGRETARRGLDFQLALWTQRYDFDDVPYANYTVRGVTPDNLAPYCRDAITALLREVPEITGLTFRVHVEGGIAEGDYAFWEEAFKGVAAAGRPVEIDMHGKGLDHRTIDIARRSGMPITASPKYLAEHMGLPYHQSAIREREYPPEQARSAREQFSEGERKFLRYSYGDLLPKDRDWKVLYRIWPGTQRVLLWGDPVLASGYGRSSTFCGSDGVEWCEPGSFKGRCGTGLPGQRFNTLVPGLTTNYDWERYAYLYRVWGRCLYSREAPRESWMRWLRASCGPAAEGCEQALAHASRVLPLVTLAHGPSASNNWYWPEIYTNIPVGTLGSRAYFRDMDPPVRFGNAPTFDPQLLSNPREYAASLYDGTPDRRYSPLDVADWLDALAAATGSALAEIAGGAARFTPEVRRIALDAGVLAGIARFFAAKFRASVWTELYVLAGATTMLYEAQAWLQRGAQAWEGIVRLTEDVYPEDLTYGPQSWLRGSWQTRLHDIRDEATDLQSMRSYGPHETVPPDARAQAAMAALTTRRPVRSLGGVVDAPADFAAGEPLRVEIAVEPGAEAMLHYRHVNQAERWQAAPMAVSAGRASATIPAEYTNSAYHLQFYVTTVLQGDVVIAPGLAPTLDNEPYLTARNT
ncbi:MAG TPA: hypothetical protein VE650_00725 [Acetobacteraceae bacterium]|nr:hypothetical protein [Acetobacteraceae bacterium]